MPVKPVAGVQGPAVRGLDPWLPGNPGHHRAHQLLSDGERARLAVISSVVRLKKGAEIYREGDTADAVFNIVSGVVKAYTQGPGEDELVAAFLFQEDLFGLAQVSADAALEFHVIAKLCHELRQAQRHAFVLASKHTVAKLTLFLQVLAQLQLARGEPVNEIYLPMSRSDIADYVGVSLAALSRAFRTLTTQGVLQVRNRQHVKIVDQGAFEQLASDR